MAGIRTVTRRSVLMGAMVTAVIMCASGPVGAATAVWKVQKTPSPGTAPVLDAVSCPSTRACTAVGQYGNISGIGATLAEHWHGSSWAVQKTPNPGSGGTAGNAPYAVSCSSASACTAVGDYDLFASGIISSLAERWNGSRWAVQKTPNPGGSVGGSSYGTVLSGVSCPSASSCTAVGYYNTPAHVYPHTLVEHWNGSRWAVQSTSHSPFDSWLTAVSCSSASACTAVGVVDNGSGQGDGLTLAERWNGNSWAVQAIPTPGGLRASYLNGVSCPTARACTAVGYYYAKGGSAGRRPLAERWNGSKWIVQPMRAPQGSGLGTVLSGVSCPSASACTAVGYYDNSSFVDFTLAEHWNGSSWAHQSTPNPGRSSGSHLYGVSCPSATVCTAVGQYGSGIGVTLAEHYS